LIFCAICGRAGIILQKMMSEDAELLRRYAMGHSEAAFADLVRRHVDLVYSAALRLVNGDTHRAQDVTQEVFSELARRAKPLVRHPALIGWLYTTTRQTAWHLIRSEQRRAAREQRAHTMNEFLGRPVAEPDWEYLRPVLEEAMHELNQADRVAVLLRFFKNKSLREVGLELGLTDFASRMARPCWRKQCKSTPMIRRWILKRRSKVTPRPRNDADG
jgi:RNA polymerase sigma factor (sigma-70 family)